MNSKLTASAVICAALISGCSSTQTLAVPTGEWESFNQPQQPQGFVPLPSIPPVAYNQGPATTVFKPTEVAAFTPPKTPGSTPVKQAEPTVILPVIEKAASAPVPPPAPAMPVTLAPTAPNAGAVKAPAVTGSATANAPAVAAPALATKPALLSPADKTKPALGMTVGTLADAAWKPSPPPPKPVKTFVVSPQDKTFRETLGKWSAAEGWTFNTMGRDYWTPKDDIDVVGSATFHGDFKDAVRKLMSSTELTKTPMQPCFHNANQALRIILINEECEPRNSQSGKP
jgi:hypothetical protein